jgi:hypothetical protein
MRNNAMMSTIEKIMSMIVSGRLDILTYLDKVSCPVHPEALLALLITCQPLLCALDKFVCLPAPVNWAVTPWNTEK